MDSFTFFASPAPSANGTRVCTPSPSFLGDRTPPNSQVALHQKLDRILANNVLQTAAIESLKTENDLLKAELGKMGKEVEHLTQATQARDHQTTGNRQSSRLPRGVCVSCLHLPVLP